MMINVRFPPEVTAHHLYPAVRYTAREINRAERYIYTATNGIEGQAERIRSKAVKGFEIDDRDVMFAPFAQQIVSFIARRAIAYEFLAETIGNADEYMAFLDKYPPREQER
jgi:hypothetical protein